MTIKEVEKKLNIPRASVRFYEKEGLISPARMENDYRDYSREDVDTLRKIIIFRKLGLSIEQIKSLFAGTLSLSEAIEINIKDLESQIDEINGALEVCREIVMDSRTTDFDDFDSEKYWNEIFESSAPEESSSILRRTAWIIKRVSSFSTLDMMMAPRALKQ